MSPAMQRTLEALEAAGCNPRQAGPKFMARCPAHDDHSPSLSVAEGRDCVLLKCWAGCEPEAVLGALGLTWRDLFDNDTGQRRAPAWPLAPKPTPQPKRPPKRELLDLWARSRPVADDLEAATWLRGRGIDPVVVADRELARAIPPALAPPGLPSWAQMGGIWPARGYRLLVALFDATGALASVHARNLRTGAEPKGVLPTGYAVAGSVLADSAGAMMLRTGKLAGPLWLVEGVPDFLTASTAWGDAADTAPAVLGILAGSWNEQLAARVPDGARVVIATHHDAAGDKYAARIAGTLSSRVMLERWTPAAIGRATA